LQAPIDKINARAKNRFFMLSVILGINKLSE